MLESIDKAINTYGFWSIWFSIVALIILEPLWSIPFFVFVVARIAYGPIIRAARDRTADSPSDVEPTAGD